MLLVGCLIVYTPLRIVRITRFLEHTVHQKNKGFFPYIKKANKKVSKLGKKVIQSLSRNFCQNYKFFGTHCTSEK